jgi:hypothetical protein
MEDGFTLNANVLSDAADLAKGLGNLVSQFEPPRVLSLPIQQLHPAGLDNEIGLCRSNLRPGGIAIHRVRERAALQPAQVLWRDQASFAERQNLTISMSMRRVHPPDRCVPQEIREPLPRAGAVFRVERRKSLPFAGITKRAPKSQTETLPNIR